MTKLDILNRTNDLLTRQYGHDDAAKIVYRGALDLWRNDDIDVDTVKAMFGWNQAQTEVRVSDEDKNILAVNVDDLPERERVQMLRRQKKARKRLKRAERDKDHEVQVTRPVLEAVGTVLAADRDSGVEAVAAAASYGVLLEPDMVAEFLLHTLDSPQTWKPALTPFTMYETAAEVFDAVTDQQVRLTLLMSLWDITHEGRWWNKTSGTTYGGTSLRYAEIDGGGDVNEPAAPAPTAPRKADFVKRLLADELDYHPSVVRVAQKVTPTDDELPVIHRAASSRAKATDTKLLMGHMNMPLPYYPTTPMEEMSRILLEASVVTDPVAWKAARSWDALYPPDTHEFEVPERALRMNNTVIRGVDFQVITSSADLRFNASQMGNCTFGRKEGLKKGLSTMWRLHHGGRLYNAQTSGPTTGTREIQASRKRGNYHPVPPQVMSAWNEFLDRMNNQ